MKTQEPTPMSAFDLEVSRAFLVSTVREMVHTTARSAYSTCFAEGLDFTCGIFDAEGRLAVQAAGLPAHAGTLIDATRAVLRAQSSFSPGDVIVHNDPFDGGSHHADVMVMRPLFVDQELVGFAANKGHWMDSGGATAGGWNGAATHAVEEGFIIPPAKLYREGVLNAEVAEFILRNVRLRRLIWGDVQAQIAAGVLAERRLQELADKRGVKHVRDVLASTIDHARRHFAARLASSAHGEASAEDYIEDDALGGGPYRIAVRLLVEPDRVLVDFGGTESQVPNAPVNAALACTHAAVYAALLACIDSDAPMSSGCFDLIEVRVPERSILNASWPAPLFAGPADIGNRTAETVVKAFGQLDPTRVAAGSYATGNNSVAFGSDSTGNEFLWYVFEAGGCGARRDFDGNSGEWHLMSNAKNESMEIWEARYPVRFEFYRLIPDSSGPGRKRGGLGTERGIRVLCDTTISALADRHKIPPWGFSGGLEGTCNAIRVERDGKIYRPSELGAASDSKFGGLRLRAGDVYIVRQGGGGGFGPPDERSDEEIARDIARGYITTSHAKQYYPRLRSAAEGVQTEAR